MHECVECGYGCDCDIEDTWNEQPDDCTHVCDDEGESDDDTY